MLLCNLWECFVEKQKRRWAFLLLPACAPSMLTSLMGFTSLDMTSPTYMLNIYNYGRLDHLWWDFFK